jgi:hypothetical protein
MHNNNLSPIPFYSSTAEQGFKKWYAYGEHTPLRVSRNYFLPFFFYHSGGTSSPSVSSVAFFDECGNSVSVSSTYTNAIKNGIATYTNGGGVTFYFTKTSSSMTLPLGFYYIRVNVSVGGTTYSYYSDLFQVCEAVVNTRECVEVKWYDAEDVKITDGGVIPFAHQAASTYYYNQLYLETEVGMPEYSFTEEGEDRDGYFFPVKQISEKVYKMTFLATEEMCDCLRLACQSDVLKITDHNSKVYSVNHFEMNVTWLDNGYFAQVDVSFETDTVVKKVGKAYGTINSR